MFVAVALSLAGCASVSPEQAFQPVQSGVLAQTGQRVTWNQGSVDDAQAGTQVRQMLGHSLRASSAAQIALLNNPDLQATFEDIGISQADLIQAGLLKNPTFAGSWRFPDVEPGITDAEYSVAQDFLSLIIMPLKVKVARANLEAAQDRVTHDVFHLVAEVKETFYTYQAELQLEHRLDLIAQADQAGADLAKAQHDAGNTNDLTLLNQQAEVGSAKLALSDARKQEIMTREKLNRLMGLAGDEIDWKADANLPLLPERDPSLAHIEELALSQRRDFLALKTQADSFGQMLALKTNTRFLPAGIDIGADTEKSPDGQRVTGPTLDLELPIFNQGQGEIAKLAAEYRQARREQQALAIRIRSEVREAAATLKANRDDFDYFHQTVLPLSIQSVNKTQLQFNAMQVNTYDLFLAKQRELETERGYVEAWRDYWISRTELEEYAGGNLRPIKAKSAP